MQLQKDSIKTITIKTATKKQYSCTNLTAFKVLENAQQLNENVLEQDGTAARYYVMCANIYASVCALYYENVENDYVAISSLMYCVTQHLEYYDDESLFYACVKNTALAKLNVDDYACLSN